MNLTFINAFFAIGLTAIILPIIAHLLSKKGAKKRAFSSIMLVPPSKTALFRKTKPTDILLLLLRSLLIALIVLAFTRPSILTRAFGADPSPRTVAIVIDNSFSMSGGNNLKRAKAAAIKIIDSLPDGSFGAIFPLVQTAPHEANVTADKSALRKEIEEIKITSTFADNQKRLERVYTSLSSALGSAPNSRKEVVLIGDNQKNGWSIDPAESKWVKLIDIREDIEITNSAITGLTYEVLEDLIEVHVLARSFSDKTLRDLKLQVDLSGVELNKIIDLEPQSSLVTSFRVPKTSLTLETQKRIEITAELEGDWLLIDNKRFKVIDEGEAMNVLIVEGDPRQDTRLSESYYLNQALEILSEQTPLRIKTTLGGSTNPDALDRYDIVFLANTGSLGLETPVEFDKLLKRGGTIVLFPGDNIKPKLYSTLLGKYLPGVWGEPYEGELYVQISENPTLLDSGAQGALRSVEIRKQFRIFPSSESTVIYQTNDENPFLVHRGIGKGDVYLFSTTADLEWNAFALTPVFIPFIKAFIDGAANRLKAPSEFFVGDSVEIKFKEGQTRTNVKLPNGERVSVDPNQPIFKTTYRPGIYVVEYDDGTISSFAVNIDPRESNLNKTPKPIDEMEDEKAQSTKASKTDVLFEVWPYIIWAALITLVAETALAHYILRKG